MINRSSKFILLKNSLNEIKKYRLIIKSAHIDVISFGDVSAHNNTLKATFFGQPTLPQLLPNPNYLRSLSETADRGQSIT